MLLLDTCLNRGGTGLHALVRIRTHWYEFSIGFSSISLLCPLSLCWFLFGSSVGSIPAPPSRQDRTMFRAPPQKGIEKSRDSLKWPHLPRTFQPEQSMFVERFPFVVTKGPFNHAPKELQKDSLLVVTLCSRLRKFLG